ncbi:caspase domain-containing protein [Cytidiella melzeri]|nr:caspase domain-containing protein [Cytidiella melzeri]
MGQPILPSPFGPSPYDTPYAYDSAPYPPPPIPRAISEPNYQYPASAIHAPMMPHAHSSHSTSGVVRETHVHSHSSSHHHHSSHAHRSSSAQAQPPPHKLTHHAPAASSHAHAQPHQHAQVWGYSKCTGHKKALCIGINYTGTQHELRGCVNDAKNVRNYLIRKCPPSSGPSLKRPIDLVIFQGHWGYKAEDIVLLTDDSSNPRSIPTRANVLDAMRWLVKDSHQHDSLIFHYSGHGSQVKDRDGDEKDGFDEVILPVDFARAGYISDDLMHQIMVHSLPLGCRLTAIFDSCHSGSALDLPYLYHTNGRIKGSQVTDKFYAQRSTPADVVSALCLLRASSIPDFHALKISFSGCKDNQTSADTYEAGLAVGAMSNAFITALLQTPHQTYQELLRSIRKILHDKYDQKPQMSTSHRIVRRQSCVCVSETDLIC